MVEIPSDRIDFTEGIVLRDEETSGDAMTWRAAAAPHLLDGDGWEPVAIYDRAQRIADGDLHIVPEDLLREARIRLPMHITDAVWRDCVAWTVADNERTGGYQDQSGRLWDVVWMTAWAILRDGPRSVSEVKVQLYRVPRDRFAAPAELVELLAVCEGDDDGEPVITVMQPHEQG